MGSNVQKTNIPTGFAVQDIVACGTTGLVSLDAASNTVIKVPYSEEEEALVKFEREIY